MRPYIGLRPYRSDEADRFFGRDAHLRILDNLVATLPSVVVYAMSGTGKSSLLNAGLMAQVERDGEADGVYLGDPTVDIGAEVCRILRCEDLGDLTLERILAGHRQRTGRRVVLVIDQLEERLKVRHDAEPLWDELAPVANSTGRDASLVLGIRDDYLAALDGLLGRVPGLLDASFRVPPLDHAGLRDAIRRPLDVVQSDIAIDDRLIDRILEDLETEIRYLEAHGPHVEPGYLQLVCEHLWDDAEANGRTGLSMTAYEDAGAAAGIIDGFVRQAIKDLLPFEREMLHAAARYMILPTGAKVALTTVDLRSLLRPSDLTDVGRLMPFADNLEQDRPAHGDDLLLMLLDSLFAGMTTTVRPIFRRVRRGSRTEYELVHDLLGSVLLKWRDDFERTQAGQVRSWTEDIERPLSASSDPPTGDPWGTARSILEDLPDLPDAPREGPTLDEAGRGVFIAHLGWLVTASRAYEAAAGLPLVRSRATAGSRTSQAEEELMDELRSLHGRIARVLDQTLRTATTVGSSPGRRDERDLQREAQEVVPALRILTGVVSRHRPPARRAGEGHSRLAEVLHHLTVGVLVLPATIVTVLLVSLSAGRIFPSSVDYIGLSLGVIVAVHVVATTAVKEIGEVSWAHVRSGDALIPPFGSIQTFGPERPSQLLFRLKWVSTFWFTPLIATIGAAHLGAWSFQLVGWAPAAGFNLAAFVVGMTTTALYVTAWDDVSLPTPEGTSVSEGPWSQETGDTRPSRRHRGRAS